PLEARAARAGARTDNSPTDAERGIERAGVDADGRIAGDVRLTVAADGRARDAGPGIIGDAVTRHVLVGAGHAVARDLAEDEARVDLLHLLPGDAAAGQGARAHRFDDGVGVAQQIQIGRNALGRAQIEYDALFAAVEMPVQEGDAVDDRERHLADVVAAGILDL